MEKNKLGWVEKEKWLATKIYKKMKRKRHNNQKEMKKRKKSREEKRAIKKTR